MAKKSAIDRAIEELSANKMRVMAKAADETRALDTAIDLLKAQQKARKPRAAKPRDVAAA